MKRWVALSATLALIAAWAIWTELDPKSERDLRVQVQRQLHEWFPERMSPPAHASGFVRGGRPVDAAFPAQAILVHGVDEPGGIWSELQQRLNAEDIDHAEFRYPNDQAIDASADALARRWSQLDASQPITLIGHSMGGLVIRDFVSRHRHPVDSAPTVNGPEVRGVILIAPPNHGSEWARLRVWLELREYASDLPAGRFSLFAALRDGTGAAKIDLRPGSEYLRQLNARPWPDSVPIRIIGGRIAEPTPVMEQELADLSRQLGLPELQKTITGLWAATGESVGDGAVPISSLAIEQAPPPLILPASHRGLIASMPWSDQAPPAIQPVIEYLNSWSDSSGDKTRQNAANPSVDH